MLQDDVIGLSLAHINSIKTIECESCVIEFYSNQASTLISGPDKLFPKKTFHGRLLTTPVVLFHVEFELKMTGYHNIKYSVTNAENRTLISPLGKVAVKSYRAIIKLEKSFNATFVSEANSVCVNIQNGNLAKIEWSTPNSTLRYIDNNNRISSILTSISFYHEEFIVSAEVKQCIKVYPLLLGSYLLTIRVKVNEKVTAEKNVSFSSYPVITGLGLSINASRPLYQFQWFTLYSHVNSYPYWSYLEWNFGNGETKITEFTNTSIRHYYKKVKPYTVTLRALFLDLEKSVNVTVNVTNAFEISGPAIVKVNDTAVYQLQSLIPINETWIYSWNFGKKKTNVNLKGQTNVTTIFVNGGKHNVTCILEANIANVKREFQTTIIEPIVDLDIILSKGQKKFPNTNFTMEAFHVHGNEVNYTWYSADFRLVFVIDSEITLTTNLTGYLELTLFATNYFYKVNVTKKVLVLEPLKYFEVIDLSGVQEVGLESTFMIKSTGGKNVTYQFCFENDPNIIVTDKQNLTYIFNYTGHFSVEINVLFDGSRELCQEFSVVSCNITIDKYIHKPISALIVSYFNLQGELELINNTIDIPTRKELWLNLTSVDGSDVTFNVTLQGTILLPSINSSPHLLNTVAIMPLADINFWFPGIYHCEVEVGNAINSKKQQFFIYAYEEIKNVTLKNPKFTEPLENITFVSVLELGSNCTFKWEFSDGYQETCQCSRYTRSFTPGIHDVKVTVINPVSTVSVNSSVFVLLKLSGLTFSCEKNVLKTNEDLIAFFGFHSGNLVRLRIHIAGQNFISPITNITGPYNSSLSLKFQTPGIYKLSIIIDNPSGAFLSLPHIFTVQEVIYSVYLKVQPNDMMYIGEDVILTIGVFGGTNASAKIEINTRNGLVVVGYEFKFRQCQFLICGVSKIIHHFDVADAYRIQGTVYNLVSHVNVSSNEIFVIASSDQDIMKDNLELAVGSVVFQKPTKMHIIENNGFTFFFCDLSINKTTKIRIEADSPRTLTHIFPNPGDHYLSLSCLSPFGEVSTTAIAYVQLSLNIENIQTPIQCVKYGDPFEVKFYLKDRQMTQYLTVSVLMNDTEVMKFEDINEQVVKFTISQSAYLKSGTTKLSVNLRNYVDEIIFQRDVCIMRAIEDASCQTPVLWRYWSPTPFKVTIKTESNVDMQISFGDSETYNLKNYNQTVIHYNHKYQNAGKFDYLITVSNSVSTKLISGSIEIIQAVSNVTVVHEKIIDWPTNKIIFSVQFREEISTNSGLTFQIYFGDGHVTEFQPLGSILNSDNNEYYLRSHVYEKPGCYTPVITIKSKINSVVIKSEVVVSNINELTLHVSSASGNSTIQQYFRDDFPVLVVINNAQDLCYTYELTIQSLNETYVETSLKSDMAIHTLLGKPGFYQLNVTVAIGGQNFTIPGTSFTLLKGLPRLAVLLLTSTFEKKNMAILTKGDPSIFSFIDINFGDKEVQKISPSFVKFYSSQFGDTKVPFQGEDLHYFNVSHSYNSTGLFQVQVSSQNEISNVKVTQNILISEIYCENPNVKILTDSKMLRFHYQKKIMLLSNVKVVCGTSKKLLFTWRLYRSSQWEADNQVASNGKVDSRLCLLVCLLLFYLFFARFLSY